MSELRSASFWVQGIPRPKGSMVAFKSATTDRIIMQPRNPKDLRAWTADIGHAAMQAWHGVPSMRGIDLFLRFHLPRPKSHYGTGRNVDKLKDSAPVIPIVQPDFDKLTRAVCDALTGIIYRDDAQVATAHIYKLYAVTVPGIEIVVKEMG